MRTPTARSIALLAVLLTVAGLPASVAGQRDHAEARDHHEASSPDAVRRVVGEFHRALSAADSLGALELLAPGATVYESGHAETRAEYRAGHLSTDVAFAASVPRKVVGDEVVLHGPMALYTAVLRRSGTFRGREIDSTGVETMVLRLDDQGRWRIRHIHWSSR